MKLLEGKTAIITGGSRGIGKGIVEIFAQHGANVAFTYNSSAAPAEQLAQQIAAMGVKAKAYKSNAASFEQSHELVKAVLEDFGGIDVLINNAGITKDNLLMRMGEDDFDQVIEVNLKSVFNMTKAVQRTMLKQRKGSIINMSSVAALVGVPACSAYAAAKGGVIGFTKTIAAETAAEGIRCNTIHPGLIDTNMQRQSSVDNPEEYVKLNAAVPMGYMGPPHTIADAALFLVSDLSTYMTGAQMVIDGGLINQ